MKREILFRGKRVDNGEWVEGLLLKNINGDCAIQQEINAVKNGWWLSCIVLPVIPDTVGQFTGLNDKNGKRIFEGDLLNAGIYKSYEVEFDSYNCQFNIGSYGSRNAEIIGNIHDNPELL